MARQQTQVTRNVKRTKVILTCIDTTELQVSEKEIMITKVFRTQEELVKFIEKKNILGENVKLVNIKSFEVVTQIYGLSEDEFIKVAKPIPTRFTKA